MSDAKSMSLTKRSEAYRRQTGRRSPTGRQRRRMDHKSRKRFGFASWAWYTAPRLTAEEKFRQRHIFAGSLMDPKANIMIAGTGL